MPHCIIECSDEILQIVEAKSLSQTVLKGAIETQLFERNAIKVRVYTPHCFLVGESDKTFIHISAKILSGRTAEQKLGLSSTILDHLNCFFEEHASLKVDDISITVEVIDMNRASYAKST